MTASTRRRTKAVDVYVIHDAYPMIGVVRCPEGDRATFDRLVKELLDGWDYEPGTSIKEPVWRWYRMNPVPSGGDYAWMLGRPNGPGSGNWTGAEVIVSELSRTA